MIKKFFFCSILFSSSVFSQNQSTEFELMKAYRSNLIQQDIDGTIQALKKIIAYHKEETQYQISLGYIYQLKGNQKLANAHLNTGRAFVLNQISNKSLTSKEALDHIVALCFAGFEKDCFSSYNQLKQYYLDDSYFSEFDFQIIQRLGLQQRQILNQFFAPKK